MGHTPRYNVQLNRTDLAIGRAFNANFLGDCGGKLHSGSIPLLQAYLKRAEWGWDQNEWNSKESDPFRKVNRPTTWANHPTSSSAHDGFYDLVTNLTLAAEVVQYFPSRFDRSDLTFAKIINQSLLPLMSDIAENLQQVAAQETFPGLGYRNYSKEDLLYARLEFLQYAQHLADLGIAVWKNTDDHQRWLEERGKIRRKIADITLKLAKADEATANAAK